MSLVLVRLLGAADRREGDVLLGRVPVVGEDITMPDLPDFVLRVEHVIHRAFLAPPPAGEYVAAVRISRVRLPLPA